MLQDQYKDCLKYIDSYWDKIILKPSRFRTEHRFVQRVILHPMKKNFHIIEVPYTCLVPNDTKYRYIFYWDSYFMFRGLLGTKREWVIPEMVENFVYIFKKYQIIPNFSHPESLGRSNAPFLSSMIFDAFGVLQRETKLSLRLRRFLTTRTKRHWLKTRMEIAKQEYQIVWESPMDVDHQHYNHKVTEYQLNRYGDRDVGYGQHAEQESGWDMTSRFYSRCHEFLPIDLNCFLYKYEIDFAKTAQILNNNDEKKYWLQRAEKRKKLINQYMWNDSEGFFYDYNYVHKKQSAFLSLAGFVPMWSGIATQEQADKMVHKLQFFQTPYGLAITDKASLPSDFDLQRVTEPYRVTLQDILKPKQWDYPNIWPPLHYLVTIGLLNYGYTHLASRLMNKYLQANAVYYHKQRTLLEKMDGLTGSMPRTYWYPTQTGFGWTNAIFYRYIQILSKISLHKTHETKADLHEVNPNELRTTY